MAKFIQCLHETSTETNVEEQKVTARAGVLQAVEVLEHLVVMIAEISCIQKLKNAFL